MAITDTDGYKKFKEVGDKLKADGVVKEEKQLAQKEEALNTLAAIRSNPELAKMYSESAKIGADNLAGELPLLKIHSVGRSTKNELADGSEPKDGAFFYKPNQEQFETINAHILTISEGFRALGIAQGDGQAKEVFNQIVGGVIIDGAEYKPFIMYFTGLKLSYLWEFGKQASKYTNAQPMPIPMFALTVKLSTAKVANTYGKSWIVNFDIEKNEDGSPKLITDLGKFQFLKDNVATVEDTIASLIDTKTAREAEEQPVQTLAEQNDAYADEQVDLNKIPF